MFDCLTIALPLNGDDLNWLVPIIIMSNEEDQPVVSGEIKMEYTVPGLPVTDIITIKFQISDLRKILMAYVRRITDIQLYKLNLFVMLLVNLLFTA